MPETKSFVKQVQTFMLCSRRRGMAASQDYHARQVSRLVRVMHDLGVDTPNLKDVISESLTRSPSRTVERRLRAWVRNNSGLIQRRKSKKHGVLVSVYEAVKGGFDPDGGPFVTLCEEHGSLCNHETLSLALGHAPHCEWCEDCQHRASNSKE